MAPGGGGAPSPENGAPGPAIKGPRAGGRAAMAEADPQAQMLAELESLHARVVRLEGWYDKAKEAVKAAAHKAEEMVRGKSNKDLTQLDVLHALQAVDKRARHTQGDEFAFRVGDTDYTLHWAEGAGFTISGGAVTDESVPNLQLLHEWLRLRQASRAATSANLHRYTAAVLRQQASARRR